MKIPRNCICAVAVPEQVLSMSNMNSSLCFDFTDPVFLSLDVETKEEHTAKFSAADINHMLESRTC